MALDASFANCPDEKFAIKENFEVEFRKLIYWTEQQWDQDTNMRDTYLSMVNLLKFQDRTLRKAYADSRSIMALHANGELIMLQESIILECVEKAVGEGALRGFYHVRNKKLLGLQYVNDSWKKIVEEKLEVGHGVDVIWLDWFSCKNICNARIHWIPEFYCQAELTEYLSVFMDVIDSFLEKNHYGKKTYLTSNTIVVKGRLKKDVQPEDLPHLFYLDGLEGLIVIRNRLPMCLNCEQLGHMAYQCQLRHCKSCRSMRPRDHACAMDFVEDTGPVSYAAKLKHDLIEKPFKPNIAKSGSRVRQVTQGWRDLLGEGAPSPLAVNGCEGGEEVLASEKKKSEKEKTIDVSTMAETVIDPDKPLSSEKEITGFDVLDKWIVAKGRKNKQIPSIDENAITSQLDEKACSDSEINDKHESSEIEMFTPEEKITPDLMTTRKRAMGVKATVVASPSKLNRRSHSNDSNRKKGGAAIKTKLLQSAAKK